MKNLIFALVSSLFLFSILNAQVTDPTPSWGGKTSVGIVSKEHILSYYPLIIDMHGVSPSLTVKSFTMLLISDGTVISLASPNNRLTADMEMVLDRCMSGNIIYFEDIKIEMPDGTERDMERMKFYVEKVRQRPILTYQIEEISDYEQDSTKKVLNSNNQLVTGLVTGSKNDEFINHYSLFDKGNLIYCSGHYPSNMLHHIHHFTSDSIKNSVYYWENGNIKNEGNYKVIDNESNQLEPVGIHKTYYEKGHVSYEKVLDNEGTIIKTTWFSENGKPQTMDEYIDFENSWYIKTTEYKRNGNISSKVCTDSDGNTIPCP